MKRLIKPLTDFVFYDFKRLMLIELLIKLLGIFVVFPLLRIGFYFSLRLSGYAYIANKDLYDYISKPSTIIIALVLMLFLSFYFVLEYVFLTELFHESKSKVSLTYKQFFIHALRKTLKVIKKYHLIASIPILLYFILIEFIHFMIYSSSITLPEQIILEFQTLEYANFVFGIAFMILMIIFIEFIFFTHDIVLNQYPIKKAFRSSRKILYRQRLKTFARFIIYNLVLNFLFLALFAFILFIVGLIASLYRGENTVFGIIITSIYSLYWIIGILFTAIIFPVNIAIISYKYYENQSVDIKQEEDFDIDISYQKNFKWLIKPAILVFIIVFSINIITIISDIRNTQDQFQVLKQEEIIAHRGASLNAPENTLASIELAIDQGIDSVEFDIRGTKDHVPILLHDDTLMRTTDFDVGISVSNLNYDVIQKYEAGSWFSEAYRGEKIPTLEEAFQLIDKRVTVFLDIKTDDPETINEIIRLINTYDMHDHIKVMSFELSLLETFKAVDEDIETILLIATYFGDIDILFSHEAIDHFALRISIIERDPNIIRRIHQYGKKGYAWVVDNERAINIGVRADVDGFITKRPIEAREIAHSKNSNETFKEILERLFKP